MCWRQDVYKGIKQNKKEIYLHTYLDQIENRIHQQTWSGSDLREKPYLDSNLGNQTRSGCGSWHLNQYNWYCNFRVILSLYVKTGSGSDQILKTVSGNDYILKTESRSHIILKTGSAPPCFMWRVSMEILDLESSALRKLACARPYSNKRI